MILKISKQTSINTDFFVGAFVDTSNLYGTRLRLLMRDDGSVSVPLADVTLEALNYLRIDREI
jgi:hypothetical protein